MTAYKTIEDVIGSTPLVRLVRLAGADNERRRNVILPSCCINTVVTASV